MAKPKLDSAGISLFCESVAMMLAAGIQTDEAVGMLSEDIGDAALQATCTTVYQSLNEGRTLAESMQGSGAFPRYAVDMVRVGETSGRTEEVLRALGVYYDEEDRLFAKIRSAVGYPAALLCIMSVILAFTVIVILPVFEDVYVSMAGSLTNGSSGAVGLSVAIGWVALAVTFVCTLVALGGVVGSWLVGVIDEKIGTKKTMIGFGVWYCIALLLNFATGMTITPLVYVSLFMIAMGIGGSANFTTSLPTSIFGRQGFDKVNAVIFPIQGAITALCFAVNGIVQLITGGQIRMAYIVFAGVALVNVVLVLLIDEHKYNRDWKAAHKAAK